MDLVKHFSNARFARYLKKRSWPALAENLFKRLFLKFYRYDPANYVLRLNNNREVYATDDSIPVLMDIFFNDLYKFDAKMFGNRTIRYFDGGGNVGYVPVYLDWLGIKFKGDIVEPDPANVALLRKNIRGFDLKVHEVAVSDRVGTFPLYLDSSWNNSLYSKSKFGNACATKSIDVKVVPFDSFGEYDVIKLDVEGAEHPIFRNQHKWKTAKYLMVEFHGSKPEISRSIAVISKRFNIVRRHDESYHFINKSFKKPGG